MNQIEETGRRQRERENQMWAFIDLVVDEGDEIPDGKRKLPCNENNQIYLEKKNVVCCRKCPEKGRGLVAFKTQRGRS